MRRIRRGMRLKEAGASCAVALIFGLLASCASTKPENKKDDRFFTSGSPAADKRAEGTVSANKSAAEKKEEGKAASAEKNAEPVKRTLFDRLGGQPGITAIVDDFIKRALEDPRVNWSRQGVTKGGWLRRERSVTWNATPENVTRLKKHFVQFISLAAGGPVKYDGKALKPSHADMQISKAEFEAVIGDLKASLDKLGIAPELQKDLLAIFESTRPQIVPER